MRSHLLSLLLLLTNTAMATDGVQSGSISSITIASDAALHALSYMHFKVIGACFWYHLNAGIPVVYSTLELDEYLPDLVVSVYNGDGTNPYTEFRDSIDIAAQQLGAQSIALLTGDDVYENGQVNASALRSKDLAAKYKSVDVVGSPLNSIAIPFAKLTSDTTALEPYYMSTLDAVPNRTGLGEATHALESADFVHYFIGSSPADYWGYEFPRVMQSQQSNDFKASVVIAQRAADIASNKNTGHIVNSLNDRCGINCAVSNVIEEQHRDHEIWEMVYPQDERIQPGNSDIASLISQGSNEESIAHGNYVFLVWRHYRGCVQGDHYLGATIHVRNTQKR